MPLPADLPRRLAAEALGTALLLAVVVGSGVMGEALADGNTAVALLANALATGAALVVLIAALGSISGAHFNPVVTLVALLRRDLTRTAAAAYVAVQVPAAMTGVVLAHAMFDLDLLQVSGRLRDGPGQVLSEGVATFGLVLTILAVGRTRPAFAPITVGLYIAAAYWFTASTSFANPAVTVARTLTDTFAGIAPSSAPAFIVAQVLGALIAAGVAGWLYAGRQARSAASPPAEAP